jgi:hypothetical protein
LNISKPRDNNTFEGKPCRKCGNTTRYLAKRQRCVSCARLEYKERRDEVLAYGKKYRQNPEVRKRRIECYQKRYADPDYRQVFLATCKEYRESPEGKATRRKWRLAKYGITSEEESRMMFSQGGLCAICPKVLSETKDCCIDHDHYTGKVRGILCGACNLLIGQARDNPNLLRNAVTYLETACAERL